MKGKPLMKNARRKLTWLVVLVVGLVVLAFPASIAFAADGSGAPSCGNGVTDPVGQFILPGILSFAMGEGTSGGGTFALGPMQVDVPALNATTSISGLTFATGIPGWDALTISQNQPSGGQAYTISGAQATIQGPSTGYSTDASAYIELHPSADFQAQGTVSASYDGIAQWAGVSIVDASALVSAGPLSMSVAGLNGNASGLTADTVQVGVPSASLNATISGLGVANGQADWDSFVLAQDQAMKLGDAATISGLEVNVAGPSQGYSVSTSGQFEINAGNLAHAAGTVQSTYDPSTGQTSLAITDMSASFETSALSLALTGMSYQDSTLTIENAAVKAPPLRMEGAVSNITIGGGNPTNFSAAQVKFAPNSNANGGFGGFELTLTNAPGGYTVTTQTTMGSPVASQ